MTAGVLITRCMLVPCTCRKTDWPSIKMSTDGFSRMNIRGGVEFGCAPAAD